MHPHDAVGFDGVVRTGLERLLAQPRVVAVGECGLDFYRDLAPRDMQRAAFVEQLDLARAVGKPVCVHSREAGGEVFALLTEHAAGLTVVLHCFSTPEYVDLCNERGYYVSFAGNLTYKGSKTCSAPPAPCATTCCWSRPTRRSCRRCRAAAGPTGPPT